MGVIKVGIFNVPQISKRDLFPAFSGGV